MAEFRKGPRPPTSHHECAIEASLMCSAKTLSPFLHSSLSFNYNYFVIIIYYFTF